MIEETMDEASSWWVRRMQGLSADEAARLEQWLQRPENAAAYRDVGRAWEAMGRADADVVRDLKARARATVRRRTPVLALRLAAGFAGLAALAGLYAWQVGTVYANPDAGPRAVVLADGSRLMLDTGARVRVRYSPLDRRLALESGQASFEVAHNPARPFRVHAGSMTVTARGTVFNVDVWSGGASVALVQGKVDVAEGASWLSDGRAQTRLTPGQSVSVEGGKLSRTTRVEPSAATAWRTGAIVLDDVSLAEAVERVNRYGGPKVELAEPRLGELRISGVFRVGRPQAFSEGVSKLYGLRSHADAGRLIIEPAGAS